MTATMSKKALAQLEREEAIERLTKLFDGVENPRLYTILRDSSRNGMVRYISVKFIKGGEVYDLSYSIAKAMGWKLQEGWTRSIKVHGAGMDMGFHLVYTLSSLLYGTSERGGYRIRQEWM